MATHINLRAFARVFYGGMAVALALAPALTARAAPAHAPSNVIVVNTTADELNNDGDCSLREAIESVNTISSVDACPVPSGAVEIQLPASTYTLGIVGANAGNATGDLNVQRSVSIRGTGPVTATIRGASFAAWQDRLLRVESGVVFLNRLTLGIAHKADSSPGGLIRVDGGATLRTTDVALTNGIADNGGGAIFNSGTVELTRTKVLTNSTAGNGGAIFNSGTLRIVESRIASNQTTNNGDGGAIYNTTIAHVDIYDSLIENNTTDGSGNGGGIFQEYSASPSAFNVRLRQSTLRLNTAAMNGGGIWSRGWLSVTLSRVDNNQAVGTTLGGGGYGGGIYSEDWTGSGPAVSESTISNNVSRRDGGGVYIAANCGLECAGSFNIVRSSILYNDSTDASGGGVYMSSYAQVTLSTISDNSAANDGGGVYFVGGGELERVTIIRNIANTANVLNDGNGGGIFAAFDGAGQPVVDDSVIANNNDLGGSIHHDCSRKSSPLKISVHYSLIKNIGNCTFVDTNGIYGVEPFMGNMGDHGGPDVGELPGTAMLTYAPTPDSVVIDAGDPEFCTAEQDQRGRAVAHICDMGAVEWGGIRAYIPSTMRGKSSGW